MIGLVVVSHSRALGDAATALAEEMVPAEARPALKVAAGLDETTFGTDAAAIAEAITEVDSPDGVLVMVDLGSAILSAEMALEFIDPDLAARTRISPAPLVEGLVAAVVTASTGASLDDVLAEAAAGLLAKQEQLSNPEDAGRSCDFAQDDRAQGGAQEDQPSPSSCAERSCDFAQDDRNGGDQLVFTWDIRNAHGLHARPAAAFVAGMRGLDAKIEVRNATTGRGPAPASSLTSIQTLGLRLGDRMEARISGPQAEAALERLTALAGTDFGEPAVAPALTPPPPTTASTPSAAPATNRTGRQIAIGVAHHVVIDPDVAGYVPGDQAAELARLGAAIDTVGDTLRRLETGAADDIYAIQELMLTDATDQLREDMAHAASAVDVTRARFTALAGELETIDDPYLKARAEDQRGLRRMVLRALLGQPVTPGLASGILIMGELDPLTAGAVDPELCQGIITTSGGATGHGAILAQARGLALLTGRAEAANIADGTTVAIDPVKGLLVIDPSEAQIADLKREQTEREDQAVRAARLSGEPALTASGKRVLVEANLSSVQEALDAARAGADGCGLVRTEVMFGSWDHAPSAEEQAALFIKIGQALDGRFITIRTWDPGGDKPLAAIPQDAEPNPMLGERGVRAMQRLPLVFDEQVTAILLAGREVRVRMMFPMITLPDEMVWARERLAALQRKIGVEVPVGMMVETPSAAVRARDYVGLADFISVGTNDLTQYTMAVDRGNPTVAHVAAGENAAVWDLMGMAAAAFAGKPVAVCGDLASHPDAVARLIGLGVTELSVRPPLIGLIKEAVRAA